jgi:hypothetical protein
MSLLTRRQLLTFFGATAAATALGPTLERLGPAAGRVEASGGAWVQSFTPVRLPHPLPIYTTRSSYLANPMERGKCFALRGSTGKRAEPTGCRGSASSTASGPTRTRSSPVGGADPISRGTRTF